MSIFTKTAIKNAANYAAATYDSVAIIAREVARRLDARLDFMRIQPQVILDLGAGTGYSSGFLAKRYPEAQIIAVDFAESMLKQAQKNHSAQPEITWICADAEQLPLPEFSVDLVVSNFMLPWCEDIEAVLAETQRVLKPGGLLLFSTLGPDTLQELRASWAEVDEMAHVHVFFDMHDIGDAILRAHLVEPVMDREVIMLSYANPRQLLRDLKLCGWQNLLVERHQFLTGKKRLQKFLENYEKWRDKESRFPVTYEVIYGHAFCVEKRFNENMQEFSISVSEIKRRR
ncbi:MAG TPA: malonyl-ACP O-methyltransferase BioC [Gammaproteobacteria bacterium]|nr:malonyl-ACP O-methyltransferase BioC [Gammaproteobacteria bacterium]